MSLLDARPFLDRTRTILARHALGETGVHARWTLPGGDRAPNPYGAADAANLLYTLDEFPTDAATRAAWVASLRSCLMDLAARLCLATRDPFRGRSLVCGTTRHGGSGVSWFARRGPMQRCS